MKKGRISSKQSFEENFKRDVSDNTNEKMDLSLVTKFKYYNNRLKETLIYEQSMHEAISGFTLSAEPSDKFKKLDYNKVFNEGVWRRVGTRNILYLGNDALRIQIKSLQVRTNKSEQKRDFVNNYLKAMEYVGYNAGSIMKVRNAFNKTSYTKLSILIRKGILPSINFLYIQEDKNKLTIEEILAIESEEIDAIINALNRGVSKEEVEKVKNLSENLKENIKERYKLRERLEKQKTSLEERKKQGKKYNKTLENQIEKTKRHLQSKTKMINKRTRQLESKKRKSKGYAKYKKKNKI